MVLLFSAKTLVKYGANLVSDFNGVASCFVERSFYYCFGVHKLHLVKNLTPLRASPTRKWVWASKSRCAMLLLRRRFLYSSWNLHFFQADLNEKMMKAICILGMLQHLALRISKEVAPDLDFSMTTYGLTHLASNLPKLSVRGLRKITKSPTSSSHNLTFRSLHAIVSSWYFYKLATALSLSGSSNTM
jgi:hypothetical protein